MRPHPHNSSGIQKGCSFFNLTHFLFLDTSLSYPPTAQTTAIFLTPTGKERTKIPTDIMTKPLSLVTGACGFMGTHMVEILHEAGHRVRATDLHAAFQQDDLKTGRFPSVIKKIPDHEFIAADLTHPQEIAKLLEGVDYVFHIAAIFSYSIPYDVLYRVNVTGTKNLIEGLLNTPSFKKLVLWAAGGVFRFPKNAEDLPITENSPIEPQNAYLQSKWEQECLVKEFFAKHHLRFSSLKPTTVYGPRAVYGAGQMFLDPLRMKVIRAPKNFTARIPTIHVRDVCRAALHLATHPETDGESYIINDDSQATVVQFLEMMARYSGKKFQKMPAVPMSLLKPILQMVAKAQKFRKTVFGGPPPKLESDSLKYFGVDFVCSNEKIKKTGFTFEYPEFEKGIQDTIPWYRENYDL